jgi:polar amino acid transport system substrate-binding protein
LRNLETGGVRPDRPAGALRAESQSFFPRGIAMNLRRSLLLAFASILLPLGAQAQDALRVVTDATFPPMEFSKDGKRTGFDIELVEALGAQMGRKIEWIDIDFKGLIPALVSRRADMAMSAIYITDERRKVVVFRDR